MPQYKEFKTHDKSNRRPVIMSKKIYVNQNINIQGNKFFGKFRTFCKQIYQRK